MKRALTTAGSILLFSAVSMGEELPRYHFGPGTERQYHLRELPADLKVPEDEPILGFLVDLNGDGKKDFIRLIQINCGTGGCSYWLLDGATSKKIGHIFGSAIFVMNASTNGWPVLKVYSHGGAQDGAFADFVFDGAEYGVTSVIKLHGKQIEDLFEKYRPVLELKP